MLMPDPFSDLPILGPDDPIDHEEIDDDAPGPDVPRTVLVTGARGNIGRKLCAAWAGRYEMIRIDRDDDPDDSDLIVADLAEWDDDWAALFEEADVVVHLAANRDESASWPDLIAPNLDATANVLMAAVQAGLDRVVLASSTHVAGGFRDTDQLTAITPDLAPLPASPYGASKLMAERLGRCLAASTGLAVVALRLGWVQPGANQPETLGDSPYAPVWLSDRDLIEICTRAVEADLEEGAFVVVHGRSDVAGSRWSLDEAAAILGYTPQDRWPRETDA
jgi:nucleoside-diphosphate-sugar epimerase